MVVLRGSTIGRTEHFEMPETDVLSSVSRRGERDDGSGARGGAREESARRGDMREDRSTNLVDAVKAGEGYPATAEAKEN